MARLKGAKIMVAAPNAATNLVMQSAGFQQESRRIASRIMPQLRMDSYKGRQPSMTTYRTLGTFNGTRRAGTEIKYHKTPHSDDTLKGLGL
nr:MAG TPA: hypothetical protein [Caudoviricetes sp.]